MYVKRITFFSGHQNNYFLHIDQQTDIFIWNSSPENCFFFNGFWQI